VHPVSKDAFDKLYLTGMYILRRDERYIDSLLEWMHKIRMFATNIQRDREREDSWNSRIKDYLGQLLNQPCIPTILYHNGVFYKCGEFTNHKIILY
jgi:hypothetical protein